MHSHILLTCVCECCTCMPECTCMANANCKALNQLIHERDILSERCCIAWSTEESDTRISKQASLKQLASRLLRCIYIYIYMYIYIYIHTYIHICKYYVSLSLCLSLSISLSFPFMQEGMTQCCREWSLWCHAIIVFLFGHLKSKPQSKLGL